MTDQCLRLDTNRKDYFDETSWEEMDNLPLARKSHMLVAYADSVYAIGGRNSAGLEKQTNWRWTESKSWEAVTKIPRKIAAGSAIADHTYGYIFVAGGRYLNNGVVKNNDLAYYYDVLNDKWETTKGDSTPSLGTQEDPGLTIIIRKHDGHRMLLVTGWNNAQYSWYDLTKFYESGSSTWTVFNAQYKTFRASLISLSPTESFQV